MVVDELKPDPPIVTIGLGRFSNNLKLFDTEAMLQQSRYVYRNTQYKEQTTWRGNTLATGQETTWRGNTLATGQETTWRGNTLATGHLQLGEVTL